MKLQRRVALGVLLVASVAALLGINTFFFVRISRDIATMRTSSGAVRQIGSTSTKLPHAVPTNDDPFIGSASARVSLIVFHDYDCVFCKSFFEETLSKIEEDYVSTGLVKIIIKNYPLERIHPQARRAAKIAECAAMTGQFREVHDILLSNGSQAVSSRHVDELRKAGIDYESIVACVDSGKADSLVSDDIETATKIGVRGTPSFVIGDTLYTGTRSYQEIASLLESELLDSEIRITLHAASSLFGSGQEDTTFIDVRKTVDYSKGHIPGALGMPYDSPEFRSTVRSLNPDRRYVVYCSLGSTSRKAVRLMRRLGLHESLSLDGGYAGWVGAGKEVQ